MTDRRITAQNVASAADGTVATEFEFRTVKGGEYYLYRSQWKLMKANDNWPTTTFVALNPHKPRPDWSPPEYLLPGWVIKDSEWERWWWCKNKPVWTDQALRSADWKVEGPQWGLQFLDQTGWPDVEPEHSLYECKGHQCKFIFGACECGKQKHPAVQGQNDFGVR